ncbi:MAG: FliI/YscN family ATPase [Myxococcales bacterium]|nr:FliI/YscN family ATPase [Myxococcales bacterium]
MTLDLERIADTLAGLDPGLDGVRARGRLRAVVGLTIEADVPGVRLGELVRIERREAEPVLAEVVGFRDAVAMLLPFDEPSGLGSDDAVVPLGRRLQVPTGPALLGRVLDALGRPADGLPAPEGELRDVMAKAPPPLSRPPIERPLPLGVRALDAFVTLGEGQRVGLFAGSGVGKSSLLGQIARGAEADVFVVCLVGERGREVRDFIDEALGAAGMARGVVVQATSDNPPLLRMKCPFTATAIAEGFRARGRRVLLLMDSVTRFARAARDVGLAAGEPPARRGYPPSVLTALPALLERAGRSAEGSITGVYTVLVEGDERDDPVADELRGLLDGHIVLDRQLAARSHYPAVDVPASLSRLMPRLASSEHRRQADAVRALLATYQAKRELVTLGAYRRGSDRQLDAALDHIEAIESFLRQRQDEHSPLATTLSQLTQLLV